MPKFVGRTIGGVKVIQNNAPQTKDRMKVSYSQAKLMPPNQVVCSLDTTDRGGKKTLAKRWYRWFVKPEDVLNNKNSTKAMIEKAKSHIEKYKEVSV